MYSIPTTITKSSAKWLKQSYLLPLPRYLRVVGGKRGRREVRVRGKKKNPQEEGKKNNLQEGLKKKKKPGKEKGSVLPPFPLTHSMCIVRKYRVLL